eukprot:3648538-Prymnesium_polylepis.2
MREARGDMWGADAGRMHGCITRRTRTGTASAAPGGRSADRRSQGRAEHTACTRTAVSRCHDCGTSAQCGRREGYTHVEKHAVCAAAPHPVTNDPRTTQHEMAARL